MSPQPSSGDARPRRHLAENFKRVDGGNRRQQSVTQNLYIVYYALKPASVHKN